MDKKYSHKLVEEGKNKHWIAKNFFSTHDYSKKPFTIILPPPNVTGKLHLGHAWDGLMQDTIIRYHKLRGYDVMFVPGMDHAGIATQARVEKQIFKQRGKLRHDFSQEEFLKEVWSWKEKYADVIRLQWAKLGLAFDYSAERFTMDKRANKGVNEAFIALHRDGLIYRAKKAINWDPKQKTALSNIEVIHRDTQTKMYYVKYQLLNSKAFLTIATTRLETMFSDVALAINPLDKKNRLFIGQSAVHPLHGGVMPIIGEESIEIKKGTGVMKVSAHAIVDVEMITKHKLPLRECINDDGTMNSLAKELAGVDRFKAREIIARSLSEKAMLVKTEDIISSVGYSERSGAVIEILASWQWFVKMKPLAKKLLQNLSTQKSVGFHPQRFKKELKRWMESVHDWTISRQLWWGHQIPAWHKGGQVKVQETSPGKNWIADQSVLDTWFSSALAPFLFLDWPKKSKTLKRYYPTSLLITGYDIIFFWVARMYAQGLYFMKEIPFKEVLIHGLIRDEQGRKMSKSLGNGIDPMTVIDSHGVDALRWFLLTSSTPGQDLRYSSLKIDDAWNKNNKLWNVARYIIFSMPTSDKKSSAVDGWINDKLTMLEKLIVKKMKVYDFNAIGQGITSFVQDEFSSWYIELIKINPSQESAKQVLKRFLVILHPFAPFISDYLFKLMTGTELLDQPWPTSELKSKKSEIDKVILIVQTLRHFRQKSQINPKVSIGFFTKDLEQKESLQMVFSLANAHLDQKSNSLIVAKNTEVYVALSSEYKISEIKRLQKKLTHAQGEMKRAKSLLLNKAFVAKAPQVEVESERQKVQLYQKQIQKLENEITRLEKTNENS